MGRRPPSLKVPAIALVRSSGVALHRQLYLVLRELILTGRLREGERLPSSRALAKVLRISRRVEQRILLIHGPPGEYIIHTRTFVGSRFNRGCRTLWVVRVRVLTFSRAGLSSMRNPLQRHYGRGDLHFITFSCYRRRPYLGRARARDRFV